MRESLMISSIPHLESPPTRDPGEEEVEGTTEEGSESRVEPSTVAPLVGLSKPPEAMNFLQHQSGRRWWEQIN